MSRASEIYDEIGNSTPFGRLLGFIIDEVKTHSDPSDPNFADRSLFANGNFSPSFLFTDVQEREIEPSVIEVAELAVHGIDIEAGRRTSITYAVIDSPSRRVIETVWRGNDLPEETRELTDPEIDFLVRGLTPKASTE